MSTQPLAEEIETQFYQNAADRHSWECYTDDKVWMRRLDAIGAELVREHEGGGRSYKLRGDQVLIRKGKRAVSDEQRVAARERLLNSPIMKPGDSHS